MIDLQPCQLPENLFIFKTNIKSHKQVETIRPILTTHQSISDWWIDLEDIDKVMRIEANNTMCEKEIILLVNELGFTCETLDC